MDPLLISILANVISESAKYGIGKLLQDSQIDPEEIILKLKENEDFEDEHQRAIISALGEGAQEHPCLRRLADEPKIGILFLRWLVVAPEDEEKIEQEIAKIIEQMHCDEIPNDKILKLLQAFRSMVLRYSSLSNYLGNLSHKQVMAQLKSIEAKINGNNAEQSEPSHPIQIKVLTIKAFEENDSYPHEEEQEQLLEAIHDVSSDDLFMDIPDPVLSTLKEIEYYLKHDPHDILMISCHGGAGENGDCLRFEDAEGSGIDVSAETLAQSLQDSQKESGKHLKIVIFSACHSATDKFSLRKFAEALESVGVEAIIGMKKSITLEAAAIFNQQLISSLVRNETIKEAFDAAISAIRSDETDRKLNDPNEQFDSMVDVPELWTCNANLKREDFSSHVIQVPSSLKSMDFNASFMDRGFIGRRHEIRQALKMIRDHESVIVFKGTGGIGKSTLSTRIIAGMLKDSFKLIDFQGKLAPATIDQRLMELLKKLTPDEIPLLEQIEPIPRLRKMLNLLVGDKCKWVILFDNFEDNVDDKTSLIEDESLRDYLCEMRSAIKQRDIVLMFSTRYRVDGFEENEIEVPEFTSVDFRKRLRYTKKLKSLSSDVLVRLMGSFGVNPRALDLLDSLIQKKIYRKVNTWNEIEKKVIPDLISQLDQKADTLLDKFSPLLLGPLFEMLTDDQKALLIAASIYMEPVPENAIRALFDNFSADDIDQMDDLSLLDINAGGEEEAYYVHRLTATYLLDPARGYCLHEEFKELNRKAAEWWIIKAQLSNDAHDGIAARRHCLEANDWDKAAELGATLADAFRRWGHILYSYQILTATLTTSISRHNQAETLYRIGVIQEILGKNNEALQTSQRILNIGEEIGDMAYVSMALSIAGNVFLKTGNYPEALRLFNQALDINREMDDQIGVAINLNSIGNVYLNTREFHQALELYSQALMYFRESGEDEKEATIIGNIGVVYQFMGKYVEALESHHQALKAHRELGNKQGEAQSLGNIGSLHGMLKEYRDAVVHFAEALTIFKRIGDAQANLVWKGIFQIMLEIGREKVEEYLTQAGFDPDEILHGEEAQTQANIINQIKLVIVISLQASALEPEQRQQHIEQMRNIIKQADDPSAKSFFQFLLDLSESKTPPEPKDANLKLMALYHEVKNELDAQQD